MNYPNLWELRHLVDYIQFGPATKTHEKQWVPARALGFGSFRSRVKIAWLVFTGKADAVIWPGDQ